MGEKVINMAGYCTSENRVQPATRENTATRVQPATRVNTATRVQPAARENTATHSCNIQPYYLLTHQQLLEDRPLLRMRSTKVVAACISESR